MGGYSSEYEISLKSGNVVYQYLDREKFNPYRIHIIQDKWVYIDEVGNEQPVNRNDFSITVGNQKLDSTVYSMPFTAPLGKMVSCRPILNSYTSTDLL